MVYYHNYIANTIHTLCRINCIWTKDLSFNVSGDIIIIIIVDYKGAASGCPVPHRHVVWLVASSHALKKQELIWHLIVPSLLLLPVLGTVCPNM